MKQQEILLASLSPDAVEFEISRYNILGKRDYVEQASKSLGLGKKPTARSYFLETDYGLMPLKLIARTAYAKNSKGRHDYNSTAYAGALKKLGYSYKHEPKKTANAKPINQRPRKRKYYEILTRPNQAEFRERVIKKFQGRCFLTGCRVLQAMEAAHILPVSENGSDFASNGILLRRDVHRLFDLDLITISTKNGNVEINQALHSEYLHQIEASIDLKMIDVAMLKLRNAIAS